MALQYEDVGATHGFGVAHIHLAVGEIVCCGFEYINAELIGDILSKFRMNSSRYENEVFVWLPFKDCAHHYLPKVLLVMGL